MDMSIHFFNEKITNFTQHEKMQNEPSSKKHIKNNIEYNCKKINKY